MILCDTNILIEFYKGNSTIIQELRQIGVAQIAISVITQAELYYGALNKAELLKIQKHLNLLNNLPIDPPVSSQFKTNIKSQTRSLSKVPTIYRPA
jgi:tRNA(fMet)-specific endonuclease VapC